MESAIETATAVFVKQHPKSWELHKTALQSLPGGNTRSLLHTAPFPIFMKRGVGHELIDEDGNHYCDMVGELTAGLFGHSNPALQQALVSTINDVGLSLGATNAYEQRYASLLCRRFNIDRIRFTNSGTEANIHCISAARRFNSHRKVVAFRGGYHGSVLAFATGPAPNNVDIEDFIVCQYNDCEQLKQIFDTNRDVAAVIVEAVQGSAGFIPATTEFLALIRELTKKAGAVFIIDEVMTSRLAPGGLTELQGLQPDLVTFGKYLGGGMPFGAFGGREDIMDVYDPRRPDAMAHSGTFQNNTLMLNAGYVGLTQVYTPEAAREFNKTGDELRQRLRQCTKGTRFCITGQGSLMCIHATMTGLGADKINCKDDLLKVEDAELKRLFWLEMVNAGFWVQLRGSIALNLQMPKAAGDAFVEAVAKFCDKYKSLIQAP